MIKRILLLGGSGYLGCNIAKRFKKGNDFILTIGDIVRPRNSEWEFVKVDVLQKKSVCSAVEKHDIVINCTGQISNPINACFKINTKGIDYVVDSVNTSNKKLFHISTVAVYGTTSYADENTVMNPESPYATCKSFAEYRINERLSEQMFCILRLPNLYGKNQPNGLFAYLLKSYQSDKKLDFNNGGDLSRYFLHVDDCADGIFKAVNNDLCGTFNVAGNEKYDLIQIIKLIEKTNNVTFFKNFDKIKPIENIGEINFNAFKDATGFSPIHSVLDFIIKTFPKHE